MRGSARPRTARANVPPPSPRPKRARGDRPPRLSTERLVLRPFDLSDARAVQRLAGAREVADTTLHIPHPYRIGMAEAWIGTHREAFAAGRSVTFAIVRKRPRALVGAIGLQLDLAHGRAELGYWIGADPDRVVRSLRLTGNTVSTSIPMTLRQAIEEQRLAPDDIVLLCGFGAGLSWGSALVRW